MSPIMAQGNTYSGEARQEYDADARTLNKAPAITVRVQGKAQEIVNMLNVLRKQLCDTQSILFGQPMFEPTDERDKQVSPGGFLASTELCLDEAGFQLREIIKSVSRMKEAL